MEINLFDKRLSTLRKKIKVKLILTRSLLFWLLTLGLLMIGLSVWSLLLNRSNLRLTQKIRATKQKIESKEKIESQQVYLTSKLNTFKELVKTQEIHQAVTETIFALIPSGTELKGFDVETEGEIKLTGSVPDYETLNELLARIKNPEGYRLTITRATVNRIVITKEGNLSFDISLGVKV